MHSSNRFTKRYLNQAFKKYRLNLKYTKQGTMVNFDRHRNTKKVNKKSNKQLNKSNDPLHNI